MVYTHLDACINSGTKRHCKQHCKLKIHGNRPKQLNNIRLSKGHSNMHRMSTHFKDNLQKNSFDSDSHPLMYDHGVSASITNDLRDFMMKLTPITRKVKGIAGSAEATYRGTVKRKIEDDNDMVHTTQYQIHITSPMHQQGSYHLNMLILPNRCRTTNHIQKEQDALP